MSENPANNFANDIKANKILVAALICGVLIFSIIVAILNWMNGPALAGEEAKYNNIFIYAVIAVGIICIAISTYTYNKEMSSLKGGSLSLIEKFSKYRTILIKHMAVCEFGAIFSVIIIFLTGDDAETIDNFKERNPNDILVLGPNGKTVPYTGAA